MTITKHLVLDPKDPVARQMLMRARSPDREILPYIHLSRLPDPYGMPVLDPFSGDPVLDAFAESIPFYVEAAQPDKTFFVTRDEDGSIFDLREYYTALAGDGRLAIIRIQGREVIRTYEREELENITTRDINRFVLEDFEATTRPSHR